MEAVKKVLAEANRGLAGKEVAQIEANWKAMMAGLDEAKWAHRNVFLASRKELNAKCMLNMKEENPFDFEGRKEIEENVELFEKKYPGVDRHFVSIPDPSQNMISWFRDQMVTKAKNLIRSAVTLIKFLNKEISRRSSRTSG
ncbi:hypothetical protein G6F56_009116 [Rhizopus delemar]|nr:hypothetical protein G6F56_009116 [Rhizopus delemar]